LVSFVLHFFFSFFDISSIGIYISMYLGNQKMQFLSPPPATFKATFGTERQCRRFLFNQKWPNGFQCPMCNCTKVLEQGGGRKWACAARGCQYIESATQRTIIASTKKPLRLWFWGMWIYAQSKGSMTSTRLQAELNLGSYQTAWTWCQKFRSALSTDKQLSSFFEQHLNFPTLVDNSIPKGHTLASKNSSILKLLANLKQQKSDHQPSFASWLLQLNNGRCSAKYYREYWHEFAFWQQFNSDLSRIRILFQLASKTPITNDLIMIASCQMAQVGSPS
jgi:hypothetical protein